MFMWSPGMTLDYLEKMAIQQAMKFYQGNKTTTAKALGCAINTLSSRLERYEQEEIDAKRKSDEEARRQADFERRQRGIPAGAGTGPITEGSHFDTHGLDARNEAKARAATIGVNPGLGLESVANAAPKSSVPLPERKEIQTVLPRHSAPSSKKGRS